MRKINKIITTLFLVAVLGTVVLNPITIFADEQQSFSLAYTEEQVNGVLVHNEKYKLENDIIR